eukprot:14405234-Alexandrium_andersonii.AAC.1
MVSPYFFPFEGRLEEMFEGVGLVRNEQPPVQRSTPVPMPALCESAEFLSIEGAKRGVMPALNPGKRLSIYADQAVHPRCANKLMKRVRQAIADGDPEAVAGYAPDL